MSKINLCRIEHNYIWLTDKRERTVVYMGRKNFNAFIKRQKAEKKRKKKLEKQVRKEDKKHEDTSGDLQDMIAYVDEFGNILEEPPEDQDPVIEPKTESEKEEN